MEIILFLVVCVVMLAWSMVKVADRPTPKPPTVLGMVCTICGKPALSASLDMREIKPEGGYQRFIVEPGSLRCGCLWHPARSQCFFLDGEQSGTVVGKAHNVADSACRG